MKSDVEPVGEARRRDRHLLEERVLPLELEAREVQTVHPRERADQRVRRVHELLLPPEPAHRARPAHGSWNQSGKNRHQCFTIATRSPSG